MQPVLVTHPTSTDCIMSPVLVRSVTSTGRFRKIRKTIHYPLFSPHYQSTNKSSILRAEGLAR